MVRPIDLQDNFSKAPLAGRLQQIQQDAAEMAQRQVARETAQQQIADRGRPLPAGESQRPEVYPEGKGRQSRGREGSKRQQGSPEQTVDPDTATDGDMHRIDIIA